MKLVKFAKVKPMFTVDFLEGQPNKWIETSVAEIDNMKKVVRPGDELEVVFGAGGTGTMKYATSVAKVGVTTAPATQAYSQPAQTGTANTGFACELCGYPLKDGNFKKCYKCNQAAKANQAPASQQAPGSGGKVCECGKPIKGNYPKCYTCNQANPAPKATGRTDAVGSSIEKQNCNNATSRHMIALQGQITDINTHLQVAEQVWNFYYSKLN